MKYLDPKADLTFKKIFGKHPDLLMSLLNALLPLSEDQQIKSIEYPEINKFLEELRAYDKFRDIVWTERTLQDDSFQNGLAEGEKLKAKEIAKNLLSLHLPIETICKSTGLTSDEMNRLH